MIAFPLDVGGADCYVQARQVYHLNAIEVRAVGFGANGDRYCMETIYDTQIEGMTAEQVALELAIAAENCVRRLADA